jgi:hypothetical protein
MPRRDQNRAKSGWLLSKSASKRSVGDAAHTLHTGVAATETELCGFGARSRVMVLMLTFSVVVCCSRFDFS